MCEVFCCGQMDEHESKCSKCRLLFPVIRLAKHKACGHSISSSCNKWQHRSTAFAAMSNIGVGDQSEDDVCDVCQDGDFTDDNLIIYCDKCDVAVHQGCYSVMKVPAEEETW